MFKKFLLPQIWEKFVLFFFFYIIIKHFLFWYYIFNLQGSCLKEIIKEVCKRVKGGVVVFFPSYQYEAWFWQQIEGTNFNRKIFREPQNSGAVDGVLNSYADAVRNSSNGAMLFSVVGKNIKCCTRIMIVWICCAL